jgi:alpha-glucosidase
VEDAGDGHGAPDRWSVEGMADSRRVVLTVRRDGPGWGGDDMTILLPPGDGRTLDVNGADGPALIHGDRRGIAVTIPARL